VTIVIWIIVGALSGLLSRVVMPVPSDRGNATAIGVGVLAAVVGGTFGAILSNGGVIVLNSLSIGAAAIGALYTLFGYRCLAMRGR
jgi:uncharacterized membrane protein YeaQ/YmgE (transglycosylase-associated protein family)